MATHSFDTKTIDAAVAAAHGHYSSKQLGAITHATDLSVGTKLTFSGGCVSLTVDNGQICVNLPFGFGSVCLPIPAIFPTGTAAEACLDVCTTWGIPTGVRVTVSIAGHSVVSQTFGYC